MAFKKADRQKIIDGYLAATGKNMCVAAEFVDWLSEQPDHPMHAVFFGADDEKLARQYRIDMARRFISGLRIVVSIKNLDTVTNVVSISVREFPAYVSPLSGRKSGGGYAEMETDSPEMLRELVAQGTSALRSWLERYRGAFYASDIDLQAIEEIVANADRGAARTG